MEIDMQILLETLEKSVEKNGEKPLTNLWLLNILKLKECKKNPDCDTCGADTRDCNTCATESNWREIKEVK